jgi:hypothetical protein
MTSSRGTTLAFEDLGHAVQGNEARQDRLMEEASSMTDVTHAMQSQLSANLPDHAVGQIMAQLSGNGELVATLGPALLVGCTVLAVVFTLGMHMQHRTVFGKPTRRWESAAAFSRELMHGLPDGTVIALAEQQPQASFGPAFGAHMAHASAQANLASELTAGDVFAADVNVQPPPFPAPATAQPFGDDWPAAA